MASNSLSIASSFEKEVDWLYKIGFLTRRSIGYRHRRSSIGALIALIEPLLIIAILLSARYAYSNVIDWNEAVYLATGLIPYYSFIVLSVRIRLVDMEPPLPNVTLLDRLLATIAAEAISKTMSLLIVMSFFYYMGGYRAIPMRPMGCLVPIFCLFMCSIGVGLINAAISRVIPTYIYVYGICARILLFSSGILIRPESIPTGVRWLVEYNPLFHCVTWFRAEWFDRFPEGLVDKAYVFYFFTVTIIVGTIMFLGVGEKK